MGMKLTLETMAGILRGKGYKVEPEHQFHPARKYRFDLAIMWRERADSGVWPVRLGIEVEGGIFARRGAKACPLCGHVEAGAHGRGKGIKRDIEKGRLAVMSGWRVLRFLPEEIANGKALTMIEEYLGR